jgi:hypothetical protein
MKSLCDSGGVHVDLPQLASAKDPDLDMPYSGQFLVQLYLEAYKMSRYDLCDLIADTWIRAFHALRSRGEKYGNDEEMSWRPNKALMLRRKHGKGGFDTEALESSKVLSVQDPKIEPGVTDFRPDLLDALYTGTQPDCGARFLWADAMALCGSKLETKMQMMKRRKEKWNSDLVYDIMCTGLRMAGRKLTLKIEESTEGAWCKRYHEHSKHGLPCYRELACNEQKEQERHNQVQNGEISDEDDMEGIMEQLL